MWYVIQVDAGHETEMVERCKRIVRAGEEVFTMLTERLERRNGEWQPKRYVTFQKYLFVDTFDLDDFRIRLRGITGVKRMLGVGDDIVPIRSDEERFLHKIGGREHIIGKSYAYCEGDRVTVIDGPLIGMEGLIEWYDKRQRLIGIKTIFMNRETVIKLGVEFIRKEEQ